MGQYVFKLPDVGEGTAEAEIVAWHVRVGDVVKEDAPLVDVMTDKATVEMTAPVAGRIVSLHGEPGDMAPVGGQIVVFEVESEDDASAPPPAASTAAKSPAAEGLTATPPKAEPPQRVRGTSQPPRKPERTGPGHTETQGSTLGDKLERAPVADLHKAIALSQKFWFVAELFGGHRDRYEQAVNALNAMGSLDEARTFIANEITAKATRPPAADAIQAFNDLVERRFK